MKSKVEAMADLRKLDLSFRDLSRAFQVPKEWVLYERAALLTLGLCTAIDPDMQPMQTVGPYLQEFVLGKDKDWKTTMTAAVREMAMSAIGIPDRANRFFDRANRGEIQITVSGLRENLLLLHADFQQLIYTLLAIALGSFGYFLDARGQDMLAVVAWTVAALCFIAVVSSLLRARALRRKLQSPRRRTE
jgi:ubiquinone biosynthesis protein